ncbi:hypothetical protein GTO27_12270, partial [Candidatus Bathyarchaeota archaeon]|nr:hypothetical protein [Candidatus Bathyarchaeota archaeon]
MPMMIELPSELLKERVSARWTFLGEDAFKLLRTYLKPRLPRNDHDLLFTPERQGRMTRDFLDPVTFTNKFSRIVLKLGITQHREGKPKKIRLYCLRKWFNNNCRYEGFDASYKEFWMGHNTVQTSYISRDLERHRHEYSKAYDNLRIYQPAISQETIKEHVAEIEELKGQLEGSRLRIVSLEEAVANLVGELGEVLDELYELKGLRTPLDEEQKVKGK